MYKWLLNIVFLLCTTLYTGHVAAGDGPSGEIFELHIGKKVYKVELDKPFTIRSPRKGRLKATLKRQETLTYSGNGIQFNYHHEMKISTESQMGVTTVTAESTASPLCIVQVYNIPISPSEVEKILVASLEKEFANRKADFMKGSGAQVKVKVGGVRRTGKKLDFLLAGQRFNARVFTFKKGKSVIAVMVQHDLEDSALANKYFSVILESLK